jgi:dihydroflavonol-4-reductase
VSLKRADKKKMIHTNVTGTANLVNLCVKMNIRLLHVSSIVAIGTALPGELINENNHLEGATETDGYAISKLESEMEVWRGIAEGLNAVIVNPSLIIGLNAGTEGSGSLFATVYRWGVKFYTLGAMGFVDVVDVARSMILLMNSEIHSERFIISSENVSYQQLTTQIAKNLNMPPPTLLARPWIMELAWRSAALLSRITRKAPFIDKVSAQTASETRNYDNFKIRSATGITFKPINESIKEICEDWHLSLQVV